MGNTGSGHPIFSVENLGNAPTLRPYTSIKVSCHTTRKEPFDEEITEYSYIKPEI